MPTVDTYLIFDGNCAAAMRHYERVLGGKLEVLMSNAESPVAEHTPPAAAARIMHARLVLDGRMLMASDAIRGQPYDGMKNFSVALNYPTVEEAQRVYAELSAGGQITMPIQETFWAEAFGMFTDRFGTPWMVGGATKNF
jgi:PhnB protein